jgi:hypothetical protein
VSGTPSALSSKECVMVTQTQPDSLPYTVLIHELHAGRRGRVVGEEASPTFLDRVADPGSGAFLTPGSEILDPGSQTHIFESFFDKK